MTDQEAQARQTAEAHITPVHRQADLYVVCVNERDVVAGSSPMYACHAVLGASRAVSRLASKRQHAIAHALHLLADIVLEDEW